MKIIDKFKIQTYNIGFVKKSIDEIINSGFLKGDIVWLKHKFKDRFFADPFLIKEDTLYYYVLVEEFLFWKEIGKIVLLKVNKGSYELVERKMVIDEPYHLSFPFCEQNGKFIIPESVNSCATYKYIIDDNFNVVRKEKLLDVGLIDAVFYNNKILACKKNNPKSDLYIYEHNGSDYTSLLGKPVYSDLRYTRSAGRLFKYNNKVIRPVQDSVERYGKKIRLLQIESLSAFEYKFKDLATLSSFENGPFCETCHTFNTYSGITIVDGSKDFIRFPMKLFYKIRKKLGCGK